MRFEPTMKQAVIRRTARKYAEEVLAPAAVEMDKTGQFPQDIADEMAELNYFGLEIPPEYGGAGLDPVSYAIVVEEVSRANAAMGLCVAVHNGVAAAPMYEFGNQFQREKFLVPVATGKKIGAFCLSEPNAGSDASAIEATAVRDNGDYILNGNKVFVTNGHVSGTNLFFANTRPGEEKKEYTVFFVESEREGVEKGPLEELMGMRGNPVCPITLHDCRVPEKNLLGERGQGLKIAFNTLNGGRIGIAAQGLGIAQASLDVSLRYAKERHQFGRSIAQFGAIQNYLADMATQVEAARLLVYRAAGLRDKGLEYGMESAMAKLYASRIAVDTARIGIQIHGSYGYSKSYPIERYYRDAKITEIYEGTSEVQRIVIARSLMGR